MTSDEIIKKISENKNTIDTYSMYRDEQLKRVEEAKVSHEKSLASRESCILSYNKTLQVAEKEISRLKAELIIALEKEVPGHEQAEVRSKKE